MFHNLSSYKHQHKRLVPLPLHPHIQNLVFHIYTLWITGFFFPPFFYTSHVLMSQWAKELHFVPSTCFFNWISAGWRGTMSSSPRALSYSLLFSTQLEWVNRIKGTCIVLGGALNILEVPPSWYAVGQCSEKSSCSIFRSDSKECIH